MEKKYQGAPFGTQTARFDVSGVHPKSKVPGTYTQIAYCKKAASPTSAALGPGSYDNPIGSFTSKALANAAAGPNWSRAYEVERSAAMPHLLHRDQWEMRKELVRKLGPGTYECKDFLQQSEKPHSIRGVLSTLEERFKDTSGELPGPGSYGPGGVPSAKMEEQKSFGSKGLMENGGKELRATTITGSHIAPGTYKFDSFTDQIEKRVVSLRGPYDLFTGDRNEGIKSGYFAQPKLADLGPGQYNHKSFTEDIFKKKYLGRLSKLPQKARATQRNIIFSIEHRPRELSDLGPGHYEPKYMDRTLTQGHDLPPFLSSAQRVDKIANRFFTGNYNSVGAGRYDFKRMEDALIHRNGHTNLFKSASGRLKLNELKALQERLRNKDLRPADKVFLVDPSDNGISKYDKFIYRTNTYQPEEKPPPSLAQPRATTVVY